MHNISDAFRMALQFFLGAVHNPQLLQLHYRETIIKEDPALLQDDCAMCQRQNQTEIKSLLASYHLITGVLCYAGVPLMPLPLLIKI